MPSPATSSGLAHAAEELSGQLRVHLQQFCKVARPHTRALEREFRLWLRKRDYDPRVVKALCDLNPARAAALCGARSPADFFEQVEYSGRRLAKLNITPADVVAALRQFDRLLNRKLRSPARGGGSRSNSGNLAWARGQLQFCTLLALNSAFYQVREAEARAYYDLVSAELRAASLDDLLGRFLHILQRYARAASGHLHWFDAASEPAAALRRGLVRPRYLTGPPARRWLLDPGLHRPQRSFWSIPLLWDGRLVGVLQLAFTGGFRWLPRELDLLCAAAGRCVRAAERVKLLADLAGRDRQVRRLGEHMMRVEEEERRRISRDLHDEAGQSLLCIRLQLEMLERQAPAEMRAHVTEMRELTERTIIEIRRIIAALSPAVLEQLGLAAALRQLASRFRSLYPAAVRLQIASGLPRLSRATETTAYRLVQECFHNIAKHSKATTVNISLSSTDESLRLRVTDNGVGFEMAAAPRRNSFGLAGMQERIALLGGRFKVHSRIHQGTVIRADLPVKPRGPLQRKPQVG